MWHETEPKGKGTSSTLNYCSRYKKSPNVIFGSNEHYLFNCKHRGTSVKKLTDIFLSKICSFEHHNTLHPSSQTYPYTLNPQPKMFQLYQLNLHETISSRLVSVKYLNLFVYET